MPQSLAGSPGVETGAAGDGSTADDPAFSPADLTLAASGREEIGLFRSRSVWRIEMKHEAKPALF